MLKVTVDTNSLPVDPVRDALAGLEADIGTTTITLREVEGTSFEALAQALPTSTELLVLGESPFGSLLGSEDDANLLEDLLKLVSDGSFPRPGQRDNLSRGQRAQLRDAMALQAHARDRRDVFVSNDVKAFGAEGGDKRKKLCDLTKTKIMTLAEFARFCGNGGK